MFCRRWGRCRTSCASLSHTQYLRYPTRSWKTFPRQLRRTADPSTTLRSGRDDNSSWKRHLAFPNKIVIPTGAKRSGGICGAPLGLPKFWSSRADSRPFGEGNAKQRRSKPQAALYRATQKRSTTVTNWPADQIGHVASSIGLLPNHISVWIVFR